ncbi:hypothetical protein E2562_024388 [Oryza meyeriana var. granulata]|uniref:DUF834 domain-containing protein n=1 Tax=Oryza meyeriana var. granulata TaxID=110450 RepID=A0A6G1C8J0_9ORYZ|nr:hypothetical protein E2562_024388 [Oryza meyeriana var. granulata]
MGGMVVAAEKDGMGGDGDDDDFGGKCTTAILEGDGNLADTEETTSASLQPPFCSTRRSHAATSTMLGRLFVAPERHGSTLSRSSRSPAPPHRHLSLLAAPPAAASAAPRPGRHGS